MSSNEDYWSLQEGELTVLRAAADEAARHVRRLYFIFLLSALYVAVTVLSTTDEQLLKGARFKLPVLDVELPLIEFYVVVPVLVLIFHAHLLSQFFLLSRKLFNLHHALSSLPPKLEATQRELPFPLIFSHVIVGRHHPGPIRWAFKTAVIVTVLLIPIALLAAIQWQFLHNERVTFGHQLALTFDLLLLWFFWPRLSSRSGRWRVWWPWSRSWRMWAFWPRVSFRFGHWRVRWSRPRRSRMSMWSALILTGLLFFGIRTPLVLRSADLRKAQLQDADLREANLQNADLSQVELQGAKLWRAQLEGVDLSGAQLQGADLREAVVYGTSFQDAELSLADLRGLCLLPVGWKCPSESESPSCEPDQEAFSKIEVLEAWLEQEGEHWSEEKREWVARAIDRFWSAALIPFEPVVISPTQGSNIMHDQKGLFTAWPAPPDAAEFEQARADYRAELACTNRYIAKRMRRQAKGNPPLDEGDPALTEALRAKAESGECPELAEVLEKDQ